jgi:magnesium-transporting ATPase (P-type)
MAFVFAALLGNFLAWCVHIVAWWLREKCLWLIGLAGYLIGALSIAVLFLLIGITGMRRDSAPENIKQYAEEDAGWNELLMQVAVIWFAVALLGFCQRNWVGVERNSSLLKKDNRLQQNVSHVQRVEGGQTFFSIGAIYAEVAMAVYLSYWVSNNFEDDKVFFVAIGISLLALALTRPQVVKMQKRLWKEVRLSRAANE